MARKLSGWHHLGHRFGVVDSTMAIAQKLASDGAPHGTWVLAEQQMAGRGRRGRAWQSALRGGVYMTLLLRPAASARLTGLPLVFGMAARDAIFETLVAHGLEDAGEAIGLKWPNDIVARDRKLGGILLEADDICTPQHTVRVGIGINVAPAMDLSLCPEVAARYIGVLELAPCANNTGRNGLPSAPSDGRVEMWVQALAAALVRTSYRAYENWLSQGLGAIVHTWPKYDVLYNCSVEAQRGAERLVGTARGIGPDGRLRLLTASGSVWIDSGEVKASAKNTWPADGLTKDAHAVYVGLTPEAL